MFGLFGKTEDIFIIAGLGNPEKRYINTRHNAGFDAIDAIAAKYGIDLNISRHKSVCGKGRIEGRSVLLMKPLTYMNLSGEAVVNALNFYKCDITENFLVICDDIYLPTGRLRLREKGSDGGHNGLKNIIRLTGTDQFKRLRMGVGEKPEHYDQVDWVLGHFDKDERSKMDEAAEKAAEAVALIVGGDMQKAMSLYNGSQK